MNYEDLDNDTKNIIEAMCIHTGKTKERAILALIEFGMLGMKAAVNTDRREPIMQHLYNVINMDDGLKKTAQIYDNVWVF